MRKPSSQGSLRWPSQGPRDLCPPVVARCRRLNDQSSSESTSLWTVRGSSRDTSLPARGGCRGLRVLGRFAQLVRMAYPFTPAGAFKIQRGDQMYRRLAAFGIAGIVLTILVQTPALAATELGIITGGEKGTYYQFGLNLQRLAEADVGTR